MTAEEIIKLMAVIRAEFRNFETSEERVKLWMMTLGDAKYSEASRALVELFRQARQFPPQVGEIYQAIQAERKEKRIKRNQLEDERKQKALPPSIPMNDEQRKNAVDILRKFSIDIANKKGIQ